MSRFLSCRCFALPAVLRCSMSRVLFVVAILAALTGTARASISIVADGGILPGHSWGQEFSITATEPFTTMQVILQAAHNQHLLENTPRRRSVSPPARVGLERPLPRIAAAPSPPRSIIRRRWSWQGTPTAGPLGFTMWFTGSAETSTISFYIAVENQNTSPEIAWLVWNGTTWNTSSDYGAQTSFVPEPSALIMWSLLSVGAVGLSLWRRC